MDVLDFIISVLTSNGGAFGIVCALALAILYLVHWVTKKITTIVVEHESVKKSMEKVDNVIDDINILEATRRAMHMAIMDLEEKPDYVLIDAEKKVDTNGIPYLPIVKGDALSISIAAASIIAKVTRDRLMREYDEMFPMYGFEKHKGYGTKAHIEAIGEYGLCMIHRKSFSEKFLKKKN